MAISVWFDERATGYGSLGETRPEVGHERGKSAGAHLGFEGRVSIEDLDHFLDGPRRVASVEGKILGTLFPGEPRATGTIELLTLPDGLRRLVYRLSFSD